MLYTYFNRQPSGDWMISHLFALSKKSIRGMKRIAFPTMIIDIQNENFTHTWSKSTRTKINRAQKEILAVDRGPYLLDDVLQLFMLSATAKGLRGYTASHFESLGPIECSAIYVDGVMICAHVWLIDHQEKRALLYVNASNHHDENNDKSLTGRAHYYLLAQDGLFLRQLGLNTMDLMGYDPHTKNPGLAGVNQWKAGTHGKQQILYHYYPIWFYLFRTARKLFGR